MLPLRLPIPRFFGPGEILFGKGSLSALRMLDGIGVAVVASRSVVKHHRTEIEKAINHLQFELIEYSGGEPSLASVKALTAGISRVQPNWIVSIGGGSVMDAAKLAWVLYEQPEADFDVLSRPFSLRRLRGRARFVAVPTTAGTGSEVSSAAVVDLGDNGGKKAIVSHELVPDIAIIDPKLTIHVPRQVIVSAGMDALAHVVEGYVSKFANPMADIQAEKSFSIVNELLPRTLTDPEDLEARQEMMIAALMAGWVQNLKVPGIGHALAHQLGTFGVGHGIACGGLLDASVVVNARTEATSKRYSLLGESMGVTGVDGLRDLIRQLKEKVGFPVSLSSSASTRDLTDTDRARIFTGAQVDICARANPGPVNDETLAEVLDCSW